MCQKSVKESVEDEEEENFRFKELDVLRAGESTTWSRPAKWLNNCLTQQNSLPKGQPWAGQKLTVFAFAKI